MDDRYRHQRAEDMMMNDNPFDWLLEIIDTPVASCRACGQAYFPIREDLHACSELKPDEFERLAGYIAQSYRYWRERGYGVRS